MAPMRHRNCARLTTWIKETKSAGSRFAKADVAAFRIRPKLAWTPTVLFQPSQQRFHMRKVPLHGCAGHCWAGHQLQRSVVCRMGASDQSSASLGIVLKKNGVNYATA